MSGCGCGGAKAVAEFPAVQGAAVVCTVEQGGMAKRALEFRAAFEHLESAERFSGGFRWVFRNRDGFEKVLRDLAAREHECCQFVTFTILAAGERLAWETRGPEDAQGAIDVFYTLPQTVHGDIGSLKRAAEAAGLPFSSDGSRQAQ